MNKKQSCRLFLATSFALLGGGVLTAWQHPTTGYELSIYRATPTLFWLGSITALIGSVIVLLHIKYQFHRKLAYLLSFCSVISIVTLPIVRGYQYTGTGDAMTYWGYAIDISTGITDPLQTIYPAMMLLGLVASEVAAVTLNKTLLLLPPVYVALFIITVPTVVRRIRPDFPLVAFAFLSALLLLPLNQINRAGVFLQPYPTAMALFFVPVVFFTVSLVSECRSLSTITVFLVTALGLLLTHPQQAANVVFMLLAWTICTPLFGRLVSLDAHRTNIAYPTAIFGIMFWVWIAGRAHFEGSISGVVTSLLQQSETTGTVSRAAQSLQGVGGSIGELFLKIFIPHTVYSALTIGVIILTALVLVKRHHLAWSEREKTFQFQLAIGTVPIGILFLVYLGFSSQYFRHLGFIMATATIVGSFSLFHLYLKVSARLSGPAAKTIFSVTFSLLLLISLPVIHMSPYIYQANPQVTNEHLTGYDTTFKTIGDEKIVTLRDSPSRYSDALYGRSAMSPPSVRAPNGFANRSLSTHYESDKVIILTDKAIVREIELYNGFRFDDGDFAYLESHSSVNRVYTNGGFYRYYFSVNS